jgi:hypothetical protein
MNITLQRQRSLLSWPHAHHRDRGVVLQTESLETAESSLAAFERIRAKSDQA